MRGGWVAEAVALLVVIAGLAGWGSVIAVLIGVLGDATAQYHLADGQDDYTCGSEDDEVVDTAAVGQNHGVHMVPVCRRI